MELCKTCKHWGLDADSDDEWQAGPYCKPIDPDTYKPMETRFTVRRCKNPALTFCERPVERNGFGVADGSTFMAVLVTAEDFGCVRHEAA
jgi:hypothetical protein